MCAVASGIWPVVLFEVCAGGTGRTLKGVVSRRIVYLGNLWHIPFGGGWHIEFFGSVKFHLVGKAELSQSLLGGGTEDGEERLLVDEPHFSLIGMDVDIDS